MKRRAVITGIGPITCIGIGKDFNLHCVSCFPGKLVARQKCEQQVPRGLESPLVMTRIKGLLRRS